MIESGYGVFGPDSAAGCDLSRQSRRCRGLPRRQAQPARAGDIEVPNPRAELGRRGGFTLVEVLVGLTVASLALAAGFATLGFVGERSKAADVATATALEGAATRTLLIEWLSSARLGAPGGAGNFQGLDAEENGLPSDELLFPTTAPTPLHVANTVVRLYLDMDPETPERGLVAELIERLQDEPRRIELVPQVAQMELRYLPDVANATEWLPSWVAQRSLPRAVEIVLAAERGDTLPRLLRYPIRVPMATLR
jgi:prepilin-type N-terminal cleavage/methylation domain-containing protein